jgi:hypothetical protein
MHWNMYTIEAQNLILNVAAFHGCHHQGIFTIVTVGFYSTQSVHTHTHIHTHIHTHTHTHTHTTLTFWHRSFTFKF